jgi:hypothetical protein
VLFSKRLEIVQFSGVSAKQKVTQKIFISNSSALIGQTRLSKRTCYSRTVQLNLTEIEHKLSKLAPGSKPH